MKNIFSLLTCLFLASNISYASDCDAYYSAKASTLSIPCVKISSDENIYSAQLMQAGDSNLKILSVNKRNISDATITDIQILTEPFPVIIVYTYLPNSCYSLHEPSELVAPNSEGIIKISLKIVSTCDGNIVVPQLTIPTAKAYSLSSLGRTFEGNIYTVNANGFERKFLLYQKKIIPPNY